MRIEIDTQQDDPEHIAQIAQMLLSLSGRKPHRRVQQESYSSSYREPSVYREPAQPRYVEQPRYTYQEQPRQDVQSPFNFQPSAQQAPQQSATENMSSMFNFFDTPSTQSSSSYGSSSSGTSAQDLLNQVSYEQPVQQFPAQQVPSNQSQTSSSPNMLNQFGSSQLPSTNIYNILGGQPQKKEPPAEDLRIVPY